MAYFQKNLPTRTSKTPAECLEKNTQRFLQDTTLRNPQRALCDRMITTSMIATPSVQL